MCFSASSSFTAAFLLTGIGAYSIKHRPNNKALMFASIPLLFGIQQACEGLVWLTINNPNLLNKIATNIFLIFALIIWPIWIPLSLLQLDTGKIKKILKLILLFGIAIAILISYKLILQPAIAVPMCNSIYYLMGNLDLFLPEKILILIYCIPIILPLFVTKISHVKIGGLALITSLFVSYFFKYETFGSTWCFFAALLSIFVLWSLSGMKKEA